jgi:hypothetical protein
VAKASAHHRAPPSPTPGPSPSLSDPGPLLPLATWVPTATRLAWESSIDLPPRLSSNVKGYHDARLIWYILSRSVALTPTPVSPLFLSFLVPAPPSSISTVPHGINSTSHQHPYQCPITLPHGRSK